MPPNSQTESDTATTSPPPPTNTNNTNPKSSPTKPTSTSTSTSPSPTTFPSRIISRLRTAAISHPQQQVTLTCYIPPSRVGAVIGRRGATILHIQREAVKKSWGHSGQVRVSVVSNPSSSSSSSAANHGENGGDTQGEEEEEETAGTTTSPDDTTTNPEGETPSSTSESTNAPQPTTNTNTPSSTPLWTPVLIRGDPCGVLAAAKGLLPLLNPTPNPTQLDPSYDPASDMDDVVLEVPIPRARHAAIIGKKGLTIANLSADFNVRIMVPHRNPQQQQQQQQTGVSSATSMEEQDNGCINGSTSGEGSTTGSGTGNTTLSHQPTSIHIVQLEGQLENVEKCLASMFQVVCGSSPNGMKQEKESIMNKVEEKGGGGEATHSSSSPDPSVEETSDSAEATITNPTATTEQESLPPSSEATPPPLVTEPHVLGAWSIRTTQSKPNKFLEQMIVIPPALYDKVPSLGRIRNVGKATATVIRRKRITVTDDGKEVEANAGKEVPDEAEEAKEEEEEGEEEKVESSVIPVTHLLVSGKVEGVKAAVAQFESMLGSSDIGDGGEDADGDDTNGNGPRKTGPKRRSGRGGGRGRGGKKRGPGRGRGGLGGISSSGAEAPNGTSPKV